MAVKKPWAFMLLGIGLLIGGAFLFHWIARLFTQAHHHENYNKRGVSYMMRGDLDQAIAEFNEAIRLKDDYAEAYNNRGFAYGQKDDQDRAIADYTEALRINSGNPVTYHNRGVAYAKKRDVVRAVADFSEAIRLKPHYAEAYSNRAFAYWEIGDLDRAIADYDEAIRLRPDFGLAYELRGMAYERKGRAEKAAADFQKAEELGVRSRVDPMRTQGRGAQTETWAEAVTLPLQGFENAIPWPYPLPDGARALTFRGNGNATTGEFTLEEDAVLRIAAYVGPIRLGVQRGDGTFLIDRTPIMQDVAALVPIPEGGTYRLVVEATGRWGVTVVYHR